MEDRYLDTECHESPKFHEIRKYYGLNDSAHFRNCVRISVYINIGKLKTGWRNARFAGILAILSQDSAITKTKCVYLTDNRIYNCHFSNIAGGRAVGIAGGYGLDDQVFRVRIPVG